MTITTTGLTIFASTAACPMINPPTIPIVFPIAPGRRMPASRNSSKDSSIRITSTTEGNGTPCLAAAKDKINVVGKICVWKLVTARYSPGSVIAKKDAR